MTSRLDEILDAVISGELSVHDGGRAIAAAARENPGGTHLWPMAIEARVTQNQIGSAIARALREVLDESLQEFEPEKTLWLAPKITKPMWLLKQRAAEQQSAAEKVTRLESTSINNAEQLRAFLWNESANDSPARKDGVAYDNIPTLAPPPRAKPDTVPPLPPLELGTILKNRYRLESRLGYAGIGQVFCAVDLEIEKRGKRDPRVTIKVIAVDLKREPQALMAMKIAVAKTKELRHPNIVKTYGVESDNDRLFVTMEPLIGRWLGERIRSVRNVGMSQEMAWPIIEGIANGLRHAHEQGIVHSDLSPYAVFITHDGTPKIMGFGLIHALPTSNEAMDLLDTMTLRAYSEAYTANIWATHATPHPADDMYPLGVIAYELLAGKHPFERCSLTTARQRNLPLIPIPGLPRRAAKLIAHCLSFERKQRPNDAARFLARMNGPAWLRSLFGDRFSVARQ
ncbi:MAG TPA: serine/threonine-protein kinase [Steroidobacteraceae bacterium]|nr:serine/threonine-protein kinase [Steroidobacteraceae bacterium]